MAEPTFSEVWGTGAAKLASGATTSEAGLFIPSSFFTTGTNPIADFATATPEGLLIKMLTHQLSNLTETNRFGDPANRQISVVATGTDIVEDDASGLDFLRYSYAILAYEITTLPAIDPNNF